MSPLTPTKVADIPEGPENTSGTKKAKRSKDPRTLRPAADHPVARIAVDMPLAHLDRPFDYLVPERLGAQAGPGVRVRVRFAGQLTDGFVLDRVDSSEHQGRLSYLERVVSAEQVLTPEIAGLARAVADRYAGTLADVLRLAIPQRHAATETAKATATAKATGTAKGIETVKAAETPEAPEGAGPPEAREAPNGVETPEAAETAKPAGNPSTAGSPLGAGAAGSGDGLPTRPDPGPWARYPAGPAFLDAVAAGPAAPAAPGPPPRA